MRNFLGNDNILRRIELSGSPLQLAIIRVLIGMQILYSSSSELFNLLQVVEGTTYTMTIFPSFIDQGIADIAVPYLQISTQVLAFLLVLGLFTRYILPLLFVSFLLLFSFWYSQFDAPVPWLYLWFPLLIMCFSRVSDSLSLDSYFGLNNLPVSQPINTYRWPIEVFSAWFVYIYFAAGIAKIFPLTKGLYWLTGSTSHKIIYDRFLDSLLYFTYGVPFFDYSISNWVFTSLSLGALFLELVCIIIIFTSRYNILILCLLLCMHFFLYLTGVPGFMQLAIILGIALLPPKWF